MSDIDNENNDSTAQKYLKLLLQQQSGFPTSFGVRRILVIDDPHVKHEWEINLSLKQQVDVIGKLLAIKHDPELLNCFDIDVLDGITNYGAAYDSEQERAARSHDLFIVHCESSQVHVAVMVKQNGDMVIVYAWPFDENDNAGKADNRKPEPALCIIESRYLALKG